MSKALQRMIVFSLFGLIDLLLMKRVLQQGVDIYIRIFWTYLTASVLWTVYNSCLDTGFQLPQSKAGRRSYFIVCTTGGLGMLAAYIGLSMTDVINYSFLVQLSAFFTVLLAHIRFDDEKLSLDKSFVMLCFLIGAYLVATKGQTLIPQSGDLFVVLGAFLFGINNVSIKSSLQQGLTVPMIMRGRSIMTFLFAVCMIYFLGQGWGLDSRIWYACASGIFLCIWLGALNKVIEYSSPSYMSMMAIVNPLLVIGGAYLVLGESMTWIQGIGGLCILVSAIILQYLVKNDNI